jgi:diguanylate cyclase (GGDEF)-like protein
VIHGTDKIQDFIRQATSLHVVNTVYTIGLTVVTLFCLNFVDTNTILELPLFLLLAITVLSLTVAFKATMQYASILRNKLSEDDFELTVASLNAMTTFLLLYFINSEPSATSVMLLFHHFAPSLMFVLITPLTWRKKNVKFVGFFGFMEWLLLICVSVWMMGVMLNLFSSNSWIALCSNILVMISPVIVKLARQRHVDSLALKMHNEIYIDPLTQIHNRKYFYDNYDSLRGDIKKSSMVEDGVAIFFIDIDFFKQYNDHYGHDAGDNCLERVAHFINEVADEFNLSAYRLGGEEFLIFGAISRKNWDALLKTKRIEHWKSGKLRLDICHERSPLNYLTLSAGACYVTKDNMYSMNAMGVTKEADKLLYEAKNDGRAKLVIGPKSVIVQSS